MSPDIKHNKIICDPSKIANIVKCIKEAVGDSIKEDIQGLITGNGTSDRIWDILNTKIFNSMNCLSCIADVTKRGSWMMVPVFDKDTGIIYNLMRENRFEDLKKELEKGKRKKTHYVDQLTNILNPDLICPSMQLTLLSDYISGSDLEIMQKSVLKILNDLKISEDAVGRHALILFHSSNFELFSVRAVMIDRHMNIVCEDDWNKYISKSESVIMDSADDFSNASNNPSRGLKLSEGAIAKKKRNLEHKKEEKDDKEIK